MKERKYLMNPKNKTLLPKPLTNKQKNENLLNFFLKNEVPESEFRKPLRVMNPVTASRDEYEDVNISTEH